MKKFSKNLTPKLIASKINAKTRILKNSSLDNVSELKEANTSSVCFFENKKFVNDLKKTNAGLIFVPIGFQQKLLPNSNLIFVDHPYFSFLQLIKTWLELTESKIKKSIDKSAIIPKSTTIGSNVGIGANCVIGENVRIDENTFIESNSVIKENVSIGKNCHIFANTTVYQDCIIKDNVNIHSGCVIGADGFGYLFHKRKQNKIPQVGNVIIHDNVEIGANSTIDRSTLGSTVIGKGTKIDNLVQIGHNCKIGEDSILCAQVGLAGSTIIGDRVYLAGQVGVAGHLKIDDDAMVGAQSGVTKDIPKGAKYFGTPALDAGKKKRILVSEKKLPELVRYYRKEIKKDE